MQTKKHQRNYKENKQITSPPMELQGFLTFWCPNAAPNRPCCEDAQTCETVKRWGRRAMGRAKPPRDRVNFVILIIDDNLINDSTWKSR